MWCTEYNTPAPRRPCRCPHITLSLHAHTVRSAATRSIRAPLHVRPSPGSLACCALGRGLARAPWPCSMLSRQSRKLTLRALSPREKATSFCAAGTTHPPRGVPMHSQFVSRPRQRSAIDGCRSGLRSNVRSLVEGPSIANCARPKSSRGPAAALARARHARVHAHTEPSATMCPPELHPKREPCAPTHDRARPRGQTAAERPLDERPSKHTPHARGAEATAKVPASVAYRQHLAAFVATESLAALPCVCPTPAPPDF